MNSAFTQTNRRKESNDGPFTPPRSVSKTIFNASGPSQHPSFNEAAKQDGPSFVGVPAADEIEHYEKENSSSIGCENWTFARKVARFNVSLALSMLLTTFLTVLLFVVYMMASYQQVCCTSKSGIWNIVSVADSTPTCGSQIIEGTTAYARLIATTNPETSADCCTWSTHSYAPPNPTPDQQLNSNNQEQKLPAVSNPNYAYWSNLGSVQNVALNGDCSSRTIDNGTIYGEERYDFLNDTCEGKIK